MLTPESFAAANKANLDALLGLSTKAFERVEQLTALNLQVAKASLEGAAETSQALLSAKDPQALVALLQPNTDQASDYGKQVASLVAGFNADVEKVTRQQAVAAQSAIAALVEAAGKTTPVGTGPGADFVKVALASANGAFENLQKAARQATSAAEANFAAVTRSMAPAKAKRA